MSSICSHIPLDADDSVLEYCARGIANLQDSVQQNSYVSHRSAILFTLFKALLGYLLLARVPSTIRPFDFLVVSGAVHCLALVRLPLSLDAHTASRLTQNVQYCLFFVPVAAHFYHQPISSESIWLTICVKFVWILVFVRVQTYARDVPRILAKLFVLTVLCLCHFKASDCSVVPRTSKSSIHYFAGSSMSSTDLY